MKPETSVSLMILPTIPIALLYLFGVVSGVGEVVFIIFPLTVIAAPFILVGCISIFFAKLDRLRKSIFCTLSAVILSLFAWQVAGWVM